MRANSAGGSRASVLTRSWLLTPPYVHYRAGKCSHLDSSVAYKIFPEIPVRRSPGSYRIRPRKYHSTSTLSSSTSSSKIPHITYHIAASSSGKGRRFRPDNVYEFDPQTQDALGIQHGGTISEKRANRPDSGQDAFFVASVGAEKRATAFGIADGVGGWANQGVDPADFSHGLCSHMAQTAITWSQGMLNPQTLMEIGYQKTIDDPEIQAGGSTACIGVADDKGRMQIANLGDSGFLQLRLGAVHHYSNPQTHAFNTPYQLSITPPDILAQAAIFGGAPLADNPDKAEVAHHMLRHGDVLILATDGVWDNLNSQDVLSVVSTQMRNYNAWKRTRSQGFTVADRLAALTQPGGLRDGKGQQSLQGAIAAAVAGEAKIQSMNARRDGPFAKEIQKNYPEDNFHGGKVDDICVIALIPVEYISGAEPVRAKL
jgi:protein phosphatase PTC7